MVSFFLSPECNVNYELILKQLNSANLIKLHLIHIIAS